MFISSTHYFTKNCRKYFKLPTFALSARWYLFQSGKTMTMYCYTTHNSTQMATSLKVLTTEQFLKGSFWRAGRVFSFSEPSFKMVSHCFLSHSLSVDFGLPQNWAILHFVNRTPRQLIRFSALVQYSNLPYSLTGFLFAPITLYHVLHYIR